MINKRALTFLYCQFLFVLFSPLHAFGAPAYVYVNDMSKIDYQLVGNGWVYFRNLNSFDTQFTGCCYAFYLDTTTEYGKSAWSVILMKMASAAPLYLHVTESNPPTSGNPAYVDHLGNWQ